MGTLVRLCMGDVGEEATYTQLGGSHMHAVEKAVIWKDARSAVENCVCACGTRGTLPTCRSVSLYTAISARRAI